jgi:hypothetical protein
MPSYPNRCQHLKINGTQCGSPALRRNRFCYFHKRHHEERIAINADRQKAARGRATLELPVLEDANSIQVSLMRIMRLLISGQLDGKTAGLLLYALQTASSNLHRTTFEPNRHEVVLDPKAVNETPLGERIWEDSDFEEEEEDDEEEDEENRMDPAKEAGLRSAAEFLYELDRKAHGEVYGFAKQESAQPETAEPQSAQAAAKKEPARAVTSAPQSTAANDAKQIREQIVKQIKEAAPRLIAANPEWRST